MPRFRNSLLARNSSFLRLWIGHIVSAFGDKLFYMALLVLMNRLFAQRELGGRDYAMLNLAQYIPFLLFSGAAGLLIDRFPRKWVIVFTDVVRAAIVVAMPWAFLAWESVWCLYLGMATLSIFSTLFTPAKSAILPNVVEHRDLLTANSLTQATSTISTLIGALVGGIVATRAVNLSFYLDSGTFVVSAILIGSIALIRPQDFSVRQSGYVRELLDGIGYLRTHRTAREYVWLFCVFWAAVAVIYVGMMSVVTYVFGLGIDDQGFFLATIGAGMIVGAGSTLFLGKGRSPTAMVSGASVGAAVLMILFAANIALPWTSLGWRIGLSYPLVFGMGLCGAALMITIETVLQHIVPDRVRGRVFGAKDMFSWLGFVAANVLFVIFGETFDRYIWLILMVTAAGLLVVGLWSGFVVLRRRGMPGTLPLWWSLLAIYCRVFFMVGRDRTRRVPRTGAVLVAANHTNVLDPLLLMVAAGRPLGFIIAKEYYTLPVVGRLIRMVGCVPVDRANPAASSMMRAVKRLREGGALGIFPEGRFNTYEESIEPHEGVGLIALRADCPVTPARIEGTWKIKSLLWPFFVPRWRTRVRLGEPIDPNALVDTDADTARQRRKAVAAEAMRRIEGMKRSPED